MRRPSSKASPSEPRSKRGLDVFLVAARSDAREGQAGSLDSSLQPLFQQPPSSAMWSGSPAEESSSHAPGPGTGQPLLDTERRFLEPRFSHDFSRVRLHADEQASADAQAPGVRAFTQGHDVVFARRGGAPEPRPSSVGTPGSSGAGQEGALTTGAEGPRENSPILGLPPGKAQAALNEVLARVEGAGERTREQQQEAETRAKQVRWGLFDVPIDDRLLSARSVNQELTLRFFQAVLGQVGVSLAPWMAERILARLDWKYLVGEQKAREQVSAQLATGVSTIPYESNSETASTVVKTYYALLTEDEERLRRAYEELHKTHYAEQALLSFYIAHANGLISVLNGLLDLPVAPVNLVQSLRGKQPYKFLGRIPAIPYVGEYGQKYGHTLETGVVLGLMLVPGGQGGAGATLAGEGTALAETTSAALPFLSRLLSGIKASPPLLRVTRWALTGAGLSAAGQGAVSTVKAVQALRSGVVEKEDGTVEPLTEDKAFELIEAILVNALMVKLTVKGFMETKKAPAEKEEAPPPPPEVKKEEASPPESKEVPPESRKEEAPPASGTPPSPPVIVTPPEPPQALEPAASAPEASKNQPPAVAPEASAKAMGPAPDWPGTDSLVHTGAKSNSPTRVNMTPEEVKQTEPRRPNEDKKQARSRQQQGWRAYAERIYDPKSRTQTELNQDVKPSPYAGEPLEYARERAKLAEEEALRRAILREAQLDAAHPKPPIVDIAVNDAMFHDKGAHTIERHGPSVPLEAKDVPPGSKSIESRVISGEGWGGPDKRQPRSFRWKSAEVMNQTLTEFIQSKWSAIKQELALTGTSDHLNIPAGEVVGEGFVEGMQLPDGRYIAVATEGTTFSIRIRLLDGRPPRIVILTTFPGP